jgi:hypothetical protein
LQSWLGGGPLAVMQDQSGAFVGQSRPRTLRDPVARRKIYYTGCDGSHNTRWGQTRCRICGRNRTGAGDSLCGVRRNPAQNAQEKAARGAVMSRTLSADCKHCVRGPWHAGQPFAARSTREHLSRHVA